MPRSPPPLLLLGVIAALSCWSGRALAQPPGEECVACHEATVRGFVTNPHRVAGQAGQEGCASCHAGAFEHAQSGDPAMVFSFKEATDQKASAVCLDCHRGQRNLTFWTGSAHPANQVGCSGCHAVHRGGRQLLISDQNALCSSCHPDVRADLFKRSTHPLREIAGISGGAKMSCSSCHNPHGAPSRALIDARSVNDKCYACHFEFRAPVLWEHSPVKEDCLVCHAAHGSSNENLLASRIPRLCQECHMQGRHQSGTFAPNSVFAFNRSCLNCHPRVHGSNSPSGAVLQR